MRILPRDPSNSTSHSDKPPDRGPISSTNVGGITLAFPTTLPDPASRLSLPYSKRRTCAVWQTPYSLDNSAAAAHSDSGIDNGRGRMLRQCSSRRYTRRIPTGTARAPATLVGFSCSLIAGSTLSSPVARSHAGPPKTHKDAVFARSDGKPVRDFRDTWAKATKAAGVPGLLFHDLRRTAARNLRRAGIAEGVIMKIGDWRTRSVFERYAIVSQTDIADALKNLEAS